MVWGGACRDAVSVCCVGPCVGGVHAVCVWGCAGRVVFA